MLRLSDLVNRRGKIFRAFLFDLDGTLIDSSKAIVDAIDIVISSREQSNRGAIDKVVGMPIEDAFRTLIPDLSESDVWSCVHKYRNYYRKNHLKNTLLLQGCHRVLRELRREGFKTGLVTTKHRPLVMSILDHFKLLDLFDTVVTGYEVERHKPAPDIVLEAAQRLGVCPSECVMVGDSPADIEAGKRAQALTIAVLTGPYDKNQIQEIAPDFVVENLESLRIS